MMRFFDYFDPFGYAQGRPSSVHGWREITKKKSLAVQEANNPTHRWRGYRR
ncbi:MAG TPA: hypothetical protein HPP66_01985 [Planctomycetes bacterium]|nr:hypothetical protein [Planctomycetota bacterium]